MAAEITYAKVGGPPDCWSDLRIFDCLNGAEVKGVIEIDTEAGWLERFKRGLDGQLVRNADRDGYEVERIEGEFRIELPANASCGLVG